MGVNENASAKGQHKCSKRSEARESARDTLHPRGQEMLDRCGQIEWDEAGTVGFADIERCCKKTKKVTAHEASRYKPHFIYRHYSGDGKLLYVGISSDPKRRTYNHKRISPWFKDDTKVVVGNCYPSYWIAKEYEFIAIMTERPTKNILGRWGRKFSLSEATELVFEDARLQCLRDYADYKSREQGDQCVMAFVKIHKTQKNQFKRQTGSLITPRFS